MTFAAELELAGIKHTGSKHMISLILKKDRIHISIIYMIIVSCQFSSDTIYSEQLMVTIYFRIFVVE